MSYPEFVAWCKYRRKFGPLNLAMRVDRSVARSTAFFGNMMSGKRTLSADDFSPYDKAISDAQQQAVGSIDQVFSLLQQKAKVNNGK